LGTDQEIIETPVRDIAVGKSYRLTQERNGKTRDIVGTVEAFDQDGERRYQVVGDGGTIGFLPSQIIKVEQI